MVPKAAIVPLIIGVVVIGAVGAYAFMQDSTPTDMNSDKKEELMMDKSDEEDAMMDKKVEEESMDDSKGDVMMKKGSYEAYAPEKLAYAEEGRVVLFFHASWCPSCRSLSANIDENMMAIPEDVHILKVDYDQETELKKKYGVTTQHTLVQVASDGSMIKKWSGSPTLASLVTEIN